MTPPAVPSLSLRITFLCAQGTLHNNIFYLLLCDSAGAFEKLAEDKSLRSAAPVIFLWVFCSYIHTYIHTYIHNYARPWSHLRAVFDLSLIPRAVDRIYPSKVFLIGINITQFTVLVLFITHAHVQLPWKKLIFSHKKTHWCPRGIKKERKKERMNGRQEEKLNEKKRNAIQGNMN